MIKFKIIRTKKTKNLANKLSQFSFDVDSRLNKTQIKKFVETVLVPGGIVSAVNTHKLPRKRKRYIQEGIKKSFKRAIIQFKETAPTFQKDEPSGDKKK